MADVVIRTSTGFESVSSYGDHATDVYLEGAVAHIERNAAGGTVFITGPVLLRETLDLRSNITYDFLGTEFNTEAVPMVRARGCQGARLVNARMKPAAESGAIILLHAEPEFGDTTFNRFCRLQLLPPEVEQPGAYRPPYDGIALEAGDGAAVNFNIFEDIRIFDVTDGIHISVKGAGRGIVSGNQFIGVHVTTMNRLISFGFPLDEFHEPGAHRIDANLFRHVTGMTRQAHPEIDYSFEYITGNGNHFEHVGVSGQPPGNSEFLVWTAAVDTWLAAQTLNDEGMWDYGLRTAVIAPTQSFHPYGERKPVAEVLEWVPQVLGWTPVLTAPKGSGNPKPRS